MSMEIQALSIRFIDSLNFVASALAAFPKTFGLTLFYPGGGGVVLPPTGFLVIFSLFFNV